MGDVRQSQEQQIKVVEGGEEEVFVRDMALSASGKRVYCSSKKYSIVKLEGELDISTNRAFKDVWR